MFVRFNGILSAVGKGYLEFRLAMYETVRKFPVAARIQDVMMEEIIADFPHNPAVILMRADVCLRGKVRSVANYAQALRIFEQAIEVCSKTEVFWTQ